MEHVKVPIPGRERIVGLDLGNSSVKGFTIRGEDVRPDAPGREMVLVPNAWCEEVPMDVIPENLPPEECLHVISIRKNGEKEDRLDCPVFLGTQAVRSAGERAKVVTDRRKADTPGVKWMAPAIIAMFLFKEAKAFLEESRKATDAPLHITAPPIILGTVLPFADYRGQREEVAETLQGSYVVTFGEYAGDMAGSIVEFAITMPVLWPQGPAALLGEGWQTRDKKQVWLTQPGVVFDLGFGQTGMCFMDRGTFAPDSTFSVDKPAFRDLAAGVHDFLNRYKQRDLKMSRVLEALEAGKYAKTDLFDVIDTGCAQFAHDLHHEYQTHMPGIHQDEATFVFLVGGGAAAPTMKDHIKDVMKDADGEQLPVHVASIPRYANAIGAWVIAYSRFMKELKANAAKTKIAN